MSLKKAINTWQNGQTPGEVDLFDAMIGYFKSLPCAVVVGTDRTHQHKVTYTPLPPYDTKWAAQIEKEISDVFFMVFSPSKHIARMTHLQAKLKDKRWPERNNAHVFSFKLDAGQYHMLHNRLEINDPKGVYPNDILSSPLYSDSVSSYGVFYKDVNNDYDMAYEIASLISNPNPVPYKESGSTRVHSFATTEDLWGYTNLKHKLNQVDLSYFCPNCRHCCPELLSTMQLKTFENELLKLHVGTRVDFDITTMKHLAQIFATNAKVTKDFGAFIQSQEDIWKEYLNMDAINRYHEDGGERGDGGNKHPMEFNFEEIGGTYILINADMADMRE